MVTNFEDWVKSLPLQTYRWLYENYDVKRLCRQAWEAAQEQFVQPNNHTEVRDDQ